MTRIVESFYDHSRAVDLHEGPAPVPDTRRLAAVDPRTVEGWDEDDLILAYVQGSIGRTTWGVLGGPPLQSVGVVDVLLQAEPYGGATPFQFTFPRQRIWVADPATNRLAGFAGVGAVPFGFVYQHTPATHGVLAVVARAWVPNPTITGRTARVRIELSIIAFNLTKMSAASIDYVYDAAEFGAITVNKTATQVGAGSALPYSSGTDTWATMWSMGILPGAPITPQLARGTQMTLGWSALMSDPTTRIANYGHRGLCAIYQTAIGENEFAYAGSYTADIDTSGRRFGLWARDTIDDAYGSTPGGHVAPRARWWTQFAVKGDDLGIQTSEPDPATQDDDYSAPNSGLFANMVVGPPEGVGSQQTSTPVVLSFSESHPRTRLVVGDAVPFQLGIGNNVRQRGEISNRFLPPFGSTGTDDAQIHSTDDRDGPWLNEMAVTPVAGPVSQLLFEARWWSGDATTIRQATASDTYEVRNSCLWSIWADTGAAQVSPGVMQSFGPDLEVVPEREAPLASGLPDLPEPNQQSFLSVEAPGHELFTATGYRMRWPSPIATRMRWRLTWVFDDQEDSRGDVRTRLEAIFASTPPAANWTWGEEGSSTPYVVDLATVTREHVGGVVAAISADVVELVWLGSGP